jgi:hypothetical protein
VCLLEFSESTGKTIILQNDRFGDIIPVEKLFTPLTICINCDELCRWFLEKFKNERDTKDANLE